MKEFALSKQPSLTGRERLLKALAHQEADCVPLDLGSTQVTGIHVLAYHQLRQALGLHPIEAQMCDYIQGLALPDADVIERLGIDVRGIFPLNSHNWQIVEQEAGDYWSYHDEWGITHHKL